VPTAPPSAAELLDVWEVGQTLPPVQRALALLAAGRPPAAHRDLAEMPIGRRDGELLSLREGLFGSAIVALAQCPGCDDRLELSFTVGSIRITPPDDGTVLVESGGYAVRARPASSADLMDVQALPGTAARERALVTRCTVEAWHGPRRVEVDEVPDAVAEAVADAMSTADPQAEVQVAAVCPGCGQEWEAMFDVAEFLWREIDAWAKRVLEEVHTLASAYGWAQGEILSLSAARRRRYVSMVVEA
jgi:uncharacterized protein (UPF0212 family)